MSKALQLDFLAAGLEDSNGSPLSGATVRTYESDGSTAKAVWEDRGQTQPSAAGKSEFTLDTQGRAEVFGSGIYVVKVWESSKDPDADSPDIIYNDVEYHTASDSSWVTIAAYNDNLSTAITSIGASNTTLIIDKPITLTADATVPDNIELKFTRNGIINDDGGGWTLTINGSIDAGLWQIFGSGLIIEGSPALKAIFVDWFGSDDVAANSAHSFAQSTTISESPTITGETGTTIGTNIPVRYSDRKYTLLNPINVGSFPKIFMDSDTIIEQTDETKNIFQTDDFYLAKIYGGTLVGGKHHLYFRNSNTGGSKVIIDGTDFHLSTDYAIYTERSDGSNLQLSTQFNVVNSKMWRCNGLVHNVCDVFNLCLCEFQQREDNFDNDRAVFYNQIGKLVITNCLGVPERSTKTLTRWVDNYYWLDIQNTRFGGETGGIEIVYNYAATNGFLRLKNNEIYLSGGKYPITFFDIPLVTIIKDNEGFIGSGGVLFDNNIPTASRQDWQNRVFIIDDNSGKWTDPHIAVTAPLTGQTADKTPGQQWYGHKNFKRMSNWLETGDFIKSIASNNSGYGRVISSSGSITTSSGNTNIFGEPTRRGTATGDDQYFRVIWATLLSGYSVGVYTVVFEVKVLTDDILRGSFYTSEQSENISLSEGTHIISMPFWFDGGTHSFSEQIGYSFWNIHNTASAELVRITILNGVHKISTPNLILYGNSAPATGGRYVQGDKVYNTSPSAGGYTGWICTTSGSPGTWKSFGTITA